MLLTGGADSQIKQFKINGKKLEFIRNFKIDTTPRSVDLYNHKCLVGMKNGCIKEYDLQQKLSENCLIQSHWDGETWGLTILADNKYVTSGDDDTLLVYDIEKKKVIEKA